MIRKMTENEAIRILGDTTLCTPLGQAAFVGIEAIKEVQQYRAIGTVEEFREAAEQVFFIPIALFSETEKKSFSILTGYSISRDTIYSFIGKVDRRGEKIWEYDLVKDRFGSTYFVCWNPAQCAYYGILLKRMDGRQVRGCFRMGAFRSSDLERMGSILDQERIEGRWITYFSRWIWQQKEV